MPKYGLGQVQSRSHVMAQSLSRVQIHALNLIAMSREDLLAEIYNAVEENPALEIVGDVKQVTQKTSDDRASVTISSGMTSGLAKKGGDEKSQAFQKMLEAEPDVRETLREHLRFQLDVARISKFEHSIGKKLIDNLDTRGHHILSPYSLFSDEKKTVEKLLPKMLDMIQRFDPVGTCCKNVEESLFVQAKIKGDAPVLALFLLDGNLQMLDPPNANRIQKKIVALKREQSKLVFANSYQGSVYALEDSDVTLEKIDEALSFIRSLNPYPAEQFDTGIVHYVHPDVYVEKKYGRFEKDDVKKGIVVFDHESCYHVRLSNSAVPIVRVAKDFAAATNVKGSKNTSRKILDGDVASAVAKANAFIENLDYRVSAIMQVSCEIVRAQMDFFERGPGHLIPLTRRDIAEKLSVHDSTVSRLAESKYIQCAWGLFPMKYFFTSGVSRVSVDGEVSASTTNGVGSVSRDAVLMAMKKILDAQPAGAKPLSDKKLADALAEQNIKIARRTVAKYRSLISIGSSYSR